MINSANDFFQGLKMYPVWIYFSRSEIKKKFKRSILGPFWVTLSTGIFIISLSFIMQYIFKQKIIEILPYMAVGIIFWVFISNTIIESCDIFQNYSGYLKNLNNPRSLYFFILISRNLYSLFYNFILYIFILIFFIKDINLNVFWFIPGLLILVINVVFITLIISVISSRFRDLPPIISSFIQVIFFLTPVWWSLENNLISKPAFVQFNPFYHLLELVRKPLLLQSPNIESLIICLVSALVLGIFSVMFFERYKFRINFWV